MKGVRYKRSSCELLAHQNGWSISWNENGARTHVITGHGRRVVAIGTVEVIRTVKRKPKSTQS